MISRNIWVGLRTFTSIICLDVPTRQMKKGLQIYCLVDVLSQAGCLSP